MNLSIMTWNTQLYEYGNMIAEKKSVKPIDYIKCNEIIRTVKAHVEKRENAIAVLQEIPLRSNITHSEHIIFTLLCAAFPEKDYTILYNVNEMVRNQIKTTVVISKNSLIMKDKEGINSNTENYCNCFVSFLIKDYKILAVHQSLKNGGFIYDRIDSEYRPDIILGDFNIGNYTKKNESEEFQKNREKYKKFLESGYVDICNGQKTRKQVFDNRFVYETPIDHILVRADNPDIIYDYKNVNIDNYNNNSDHYPIYCEIEIDAKNTKR